MACRKLRSKLSKTKLRHLRKLARERKRDAAAAKKQQRKETKEAAQEKEELFKECKFYRRIAKDTAKVNLKHSKTMMKLQEKEEKETLKQQRATRGIANEQKRNLATDRRIKEVELEHRGEEREYGDYESREHKPTTIDDVVETTPEKREPVQAPAPESGMSAPQIFASKPEATTQLKLTPEGVLAQDKKEFEDDTAEFTEGE